MVFSRGSLLAVSLAALMAAGCSSQRFSSIDTQPEPLTPAPAGTVNNQQLPPPTGPQTPPPGTDVASVPPPTVSTEPPANAGEVTVASVAGGWNATVQGQSCKIATPQTKFGAGFRAGPLHCPPPLDGIKSWNVAGKQLALYDDGGGVLARLYSTAGERFDGQTSGGLPISLSR